MNSKEIDSFAHNLNRAQKSQLFKLLEQQLGDAAHTEVEVNTLDKYYWSALEQALPSNSLPPMTIFAKKFGLAKWRATMDSIDHYISRGCSDNLRRDERISIARLMLECLVDWLHRKGVPITGRTVFMNVASNLPHAVESAFPGYHEAGMLHQIVRMSRQAA